MPLLNSETNQKIKMAVTRENGNTYFEFEVPSVLSNVFKNKAEEERASEKWPDHRFYFIPDITENPAYKDLLRTHGLFDNYGSAMVDEDNTSFNVAFLRTIGGKGKIKLNQELPFAKVADQVRNITRFIKAYYEEFLTDYKVSGSVTIEL